MMPVSTDAEMATVVGVVRVESEHGAATAATEVQGNAGLQSPLLRSRFEC